MTGFTSKRAMARDKLVEYGMNERIRELADKIWAEEYWNNPNTDKLLPAQLNRFAELIVRECGQVSLKNSHRDDDMGAIIARQIKQHFGVEE
jgi:hypothetical protein